jgi:hypothetical protein
VGAPSFAELVLAEQRAGKIDASTIFVSVIANTAGDPGSNTAMSGDPAGFKKNLYLPQAKVYHRSCSLDLGFW